MARSLQARGGSTLAHGLALWEHYNQHALEGMAGLPLYVTSNEALLGDPRGICAAIADWLEDVGIGAGDSGSRDEPLCRFVTAVLRLPQ